MGIHEERLDELLRGVTWALANRPDIFHAVLSKEFGW
jgi:hypothetical protein